MGLGATSILATLKGGPDWKRAVRRVIFKLEPGAPSKWGAGRSWFESQANGDGAKLPVGERQTETGYQYSEVIADDEISPEDSEAWPRRELSKEDGEPMDIVAELHYLDVIDEPGEGAERV